ncbi:MAG TPA: metal-dependent transcriptional regulator [Desulfobulbaceae bacterium]|nr:metal-dependent transcriptional regulator [Desulfobulbaceae bacterium]
MAKTNNLTESQEDYLEAIYHISQKKGAARAKDIAIRLDVRPSSVTGALRNLGTMKLINYTPYDLITLTDKGHTKAKEIVRRHQALRHFLVHVLGIEEQKADTAACRMEHAVPKDIIERLIQYDRFVTTCPKGCFTWKSGSGFTCRPDCNDPDCPHRTDS